MRISDWSSDVCSSDLDQHQIGPVTLLPLRILLLRTSEAAFQHFAHHRKIVARHCLCPFDVELAIGVFAETLRPRHNHGAQRVGALNMAVVVNLDTVRRPVQSEQVRHVAQDLALGDRKSTRLNSSHSCASRMPSSACKKKNVRYN